MKTLAIISTFIILTLSLLFIVPKSYWNDEGWYSIAIKGVMDDGPKTCMLFAGRCSYLKMPLMFNLYGLVGKALGLNILQLRVLSLLLGVVDALLFYLIAKEVVPGKELIALILLILNPIFIAFMPTLLNEPLTLVGYLGAMYFMLRENKGMFILGGLVAVMAKSLPVLYPLVVAGILLRGWWKEGVLLLLLGMMLPLSLGEPQYYQMFYTDTFERHYPLGMLYLPYLTPLIPLVGLIVHRHDRLSKGMVLLFVVGIGITLASMFIWYLLYAMPFIILPLSMMVEREEIPIIVLLMVAMVLIFPPADMFTYRVDDLIDDTEGCGVVIGELNMPLVAYALIDRPNDVSLVITKSTSVQHILGLSKDEVERIVRSPEEWPAPLIEDVFLDGHYDQKISFKYLPCKDYRWVILSGYYNGSIDGYKLADESTFMKVFKREDQG